MSYQIEFTGSNVDRRNVSQLSAASSLIKDTSSFQLVSPTAWEFSGGGNYPFSTSGPFPPTPTGIYQGDGTNHFNILSGGFINWSGFAGDFGVGSGTGPFGHIYTVDLGQDTSGLVNLQTSLANGPSQIQWIYSVTFYNSSGSPLQSSSNSPPPNNIVINQNYTAPSGTRYVTLNLGAVFSSGSSAQYSMDYLRIYATVGGSTPVTIAPQTITEGVLPVGGTPITTQVQTLQNGSSGIASPSNLFGLRVNDAATKKLEASYNPSADDNEDSYIDASDAKIITAESTSLSVESFGTGAPEYIERGSSIEVKDVSNLTEN